MRYLVQLAGKEYVVELKEHGQLIVTPEGGEPQRLDLVDSSSLLSVLVEGRHKELEFRLNEAGVVLVEDGVERVATVARAGLGGKVGVSRRKTGVADVKAPMPGLVVAVEVQQGDRVTAGQGVVILEAMKMQNELRTPVTGTVKRIFVTGGTAVDKGQSLVRVEE